MKNEYAAKRSLVINPLLIVCFLLMLSAQISGQVAISPKPAWVKTINPENQEIIEETGGYQLHLLDDQVHIPGQAWFVHRTYRLLTSSGVQSMSTITASYDPSYQELNFHKLTITRDGQTINKLGAGNIETYQRETSMERHIYDGTVTAVINLTDVRVGDIVEYAYSFKGFNPLVKKHFSEIFNLGFESPVNTVAIRVLSSKKQHLSYKLFNDAPEPEIKEYGNLNEYTWKVNALDNIIYEPNTPI
jgi:hypothetical protein